MVNVKCSAIQVNSFFPARLVWGVREREREYKISWPCQKSKAKLKNSGAPFFLFSPGVCLYMKNKLQLFQVNPWQRLAAGDMFTVSDAFTARGLGNGLLVQKLLRETSVEFGVEWLIWQNKYLLRTKGMRQVTMKTLETDALFRSLVVEESAICKPLLWALPVQPQEPNGLGWFFQEGAGMLSISELRPGTQKVRTTGSLSFSQLTFQTVSLGSLYLNQEPSRFGERGIFV